MFGHTHLIAAFFLLTLLPLILAAVTPTELKTTLGTFTLDVELGSKEGKTWTGKIPLPKAHIKSPVIGLCEAYARAIYGAIAQTGNIIINKPKDDNRDYDLFGGGESRDVVVSVFTYSGSPYMWVSSLPRGNGLDSAKARINQQPGGAALLRSKLIKEGNRVNSQIHAEENAFALFETDPNRGIALQSAHFYPAGSVVGTWHRGTDNVNGVTPENKKQVDPRVGEAFASCAPTGNQDGFSQGKGNVFCRDVIEELRVAARTKDDPEGSVRGQLPPGDPEEFRNCERSLNTNNPDKMGAACALPSRKGSTTKGVKPTGVRGHSLHPTSRGTRGVHPNTFKTVKTAAVGTKTAKTKPTTHAATRNLKPARTRPNRQLAMTQHSNAPTKPAPTKAVKTAKGSNKAIKTGKRTFS